ncbi:hypothetical protein A8709_15830 [Paenibacillus pectinilyticus]|uniref:Uncharacterized protein n=1 Tax=Paenibacillus pectinilyticus TaxID=512399 RepID=A0A1C1A4R2_9BACL|nr:hypothetical protein [Paenibacillus pectinilyticus]OCT15544.1 hypothetical protein A8709_15830 [Paenibacillus pectinilyticus]
MHNLQICGLGFIVISIMYYLLIDVFEKSKRLRLSTVPENEVTIEPYLPPRIQMPESVYPMYIDCSTTFNQRILPPPSNTNVFTPASI